ncbi:retrovirus-related pol polyprotein from transposon TNT 1-94 [Tanacetum coccineum]|uniref:Retrovirus-related pol polyprotein from transposon TNT 1-94 n=1 Tax=Tanacetum coccineum TaxID=301880 RepID=A0ABQ5C166_9ASTR
MNSSNFSKRVFLKVVLRGMEDSMCNDHSFSSNLEIGLLQFNSNYCTGSVKKSTNCGHLETSLLGISLRHGKDFDKLPLDRKVLDFSVESNFDYITLLSKKDVVTGLPKLKYVKDQLCSSCEMSKAKRSSFKTKAVPSSKGRLNLLHMDLCGPMRVASINGKKYILVIVDDYSRYTWTLFLRSKDETPEVLKDFLTMIQRNLQAQVITVRTDRGTEFLNKTLHAYFKEEGIEHQTSTPRTPEQNGIVERRNRTLVEAARTMLSASKLPLSFSAKAVATTCYTQNRSIIISTHGKIAYHIINDRKPSIKHLYIFGCICYITRDGGNLDKMKEKGDPCVMVGYSTQSKGYRVYNKRTRLIVES